MIVNGNGNVIYPLKKVTKSPSPSNPTLSLLHQLLCDEAQVLFIKDLFERVFDILIRIEKLDKHVIITVTQKTFYLDIYIYKSAGLILFFSLL